MISRKPTVIQIKAEDDMKDIETQSRQNFPATPPQHPLRARLNDIM